MKDLVTILAPYDQIFRFHDDPESVKKNNPLSWTQIRMLQNLYLKIKKVSQSKAEKIITEYLANVLGNKIEKGNIYLAFFQAIQSAKDFRQSLIREFIPDIARFPLTSDGVVNPTTDPVTLLKIMFDPPGDARYKKLRSFTANAIWHLGQRFLIMRTENHHPESQLRDLTLWFEKDLFANGNINEREKETVTIIHDPKNFNRFVKFGNGDETENVINLMLEYRFIKVNGRAIKVLYDSRVKKEEDIFRKTLVKSQGDTPVTNDTCGISMVFFSDEDADAGFIQLTQKVFTNNAAISNLRLEGSGGETTNCYSANKSDPKFKFLVRANGAIVEVQIFTFNHYFNRRLSTGCENHHLYRLRQIIPLLRVLCPKELYYDWDHPNVVQLIEALQMQKIRTNYLGIPLPSF